MSRVVSNDELVEKRREYLEGLKARDKKKRRKRIDEEIGAQVSTFEKEFRRYKKKVRNSYKEFDPNSVSSSMLRAMLAMSVDLMPQIERAFRRFPSERSVYAIVALSNQCREVANDLRAISDRSMLPAKIMRDVIEPSLAELAQSVQTSNTALRRAIRRNIKDPDTRKLLSRIVESQMINTVDTIRKGRDNAANSIDRILED